MAAELLQSTVPCWSIPPSHCIKSARFCRAPIQGRSARSLGRRGVPLPLAVSQLAAAADSPPGYLSRARKPRGTAVLNPADGALSLQQLLLVQQQQLVQQDAGQRQQQHAEPSVNGHGQPSDIAEALQEQLQVELPDLEHLEQLPSIDQQQKPQQQWHQQQWSQQQQASNAVPLPQHHHQQQEGQQQQQRHGVRQQQQRAPPQQWQGAQQQAVDQQQWLQQQRALHQSSQQQQRPQPSQQQHTHQRQHQQQGWQNERQQQQHQQRQQQHARQQNGRGQPAQQHRQQHRQQRNMQQHAGVGTGYISESVHVQQHVQQQRQQHQWSQQQELQQFPRLQQDRLQYQQAFSPNSSSTGSSSSSNGTSRGASAYSVVPTSTAPSIAQASEAAAAAAAAAVTAARSRGRRGSSMQAAAADAQLPPAEECVPRAFWGLMNEELRPWHREVLVHLCYELPAPACHIYRDMTPNRMQKVLAQRAMLEKDLRGHLVELLHRQQQIVGWLNTLQARQPRLDKSLNPESVLQSQQQLLNLKAALGRTRYTLHTLQDRAAAYSDRDYVQYAQGFADMLLEMEDLAELQRNHGAPTVLQLQQLHDAAARRVLFARTEEAVSALNREAAARAKVLLQSEQPALGSTQQRLEQLRKQMQGFGWRYPPREYVAWRFKGQIKAVRSPWSRTPGVQRKGPQARQGVEQVQQPGLPPPLLGP